MREVKSLNGDDWRLAELPPGENAVVFQPDQWVPARVPGNVQWDLQRAGIIPDPFVSTQNRECLWVQWKSWLMETTLTPSPVWLNSPGEHYLLHFLATDYEARFFLGGASLGAHRGMFGDSWFDVTPHLTQARGNAIPLRVALKNSPPNRRSAVKCQMAYGWDFAPPLVTMGIWDDVELVRVGDVWVRNWFFKTQVEQIQGERADARVTCDIYLKNLSSAPMDVKVTVEEAELGRIGTHEVRLAPGPARVTVGPAAVISQLWFPNEMGEQKIYAATITVEAGGKVVDQVKDCRFGIRNLQMRHNPGTPPGRQPWTFVVNGQPTFIRGANWVPPDSYFGRIREETYRRLITLAKDAHMNMFRVWGGGLREKRWFYDLCDAAGILVWQEFPFGCANYPKDPVLLALVQRECSNTVQRIWNHPSLAIYVGGNEFDPDYNRHLVEVLKTCAAIDPTRSFYDTSPCQGDEHNWLVWHALGDFAAYQLDYQFASEFGLQSAPTLETAQAMLKPEERWPPGDAWSYHSAQLNKLWRYANCVGAPKNLNEWVFATQAAQAEGMKSGIEYFRRHKWRFSGVMFWQLNEPWPAACWSVIDYFGRPKLAYEYLREMYAPLVGLLDYALKEDAFHAHVLVTNDLPRPLQRGRVEIQSREVDGSRDICTFPASIKAFDIKTVGEFTFRIPQEWDLKAKYQWTLKVSLENADGDSISSNTYRPFRYRERAKKPLLAWKVADKGREFGWAKIPQIWEWAEIDRSKS